MNDQLHALRWKMIRETEAFLELCLGDNPSRPAPAKLRRPGMRGKQSHRPRGHHFPRPRPMVSRCVS
jgi:hypothetical protein